MVCRAKHLHLWIQIWITFGKCDCRYHVSNNLLISELLIFRPEFDLLTSPFREEHPLWKTLTLVAGRLPGKRSNEWGVSNEAISIMFASLVESTLKQYEKPLRMWWSYWFDRNIFGFDADFEHLVAYLTDIFKIVGAYGTVNSITIIPASWDIRPRVSHKNDDPT